MNMTLCFTSSLDPQSINAIHVYKTVLKAIARLTNFAREINLSYITLFKR